MRLVVLLYILLISTRAWAGNIESHPKSAEYARGLAYYKCDHYAPGQTTIVIIHGIGERGDETANGLKTVYSWGGWANLKALADKNNINLVWVQSNEDNTTDEIDYAISRGVDDLQGDTNKVHLLGYSWGGRRIRLWESQESPFSHRVRTTLRVASGGVDADDWTNIVKRNRPTWLLHAVDDERTSYKNSLVTFEHAKKLNKKAPVYYTQFAAGLDPKFHGHNMLQFIGDWPIATPNKTMQLPGYTCHAALTLVQWWRMNESGHVAVGPEDQAQ